MFGRGYRKRTRELLDRQWEENRKEWKQSFERSKKAMEPGRWIDAYPLASMGVATVAGAAAGSKLASSRGSDSAPETAPQSAPREEDDSDSRAWTRTAMTLALPWIRNWIMDQIAAFDGMEAAAGVEQAEAASTAFDSAPPVA